MVFFRPVLLGAVLIGVILACAPIYTLFPGYVLNKDTHFIIIALNFVGWMMALLFYLIRASLHRNVSDQASQMGVDYRFNSLEKIIENLMYEIRRKDESLSINILERKITSKEDLTQALQRIVGLAYRLLEADSAELALFDEETGLYHSALVLGKPFRVSAQAMLSGASKGEHEEISPDVLVQPVSFAGSILGTLRVGLRDGTLPSIGDREVMNLLALQAGLALMNAQYSAELVKMKHSSEESIRAKTGFLANLSHEIRGPLGIMMNAVELVLDGLCGEITEDQQETLSMVHSNGEHLLELINDVLDYAKVESGRITPNQVDILLNSLMDDITAVIRSQAEAKSHKIVTRKCEDALVISCDKRHIRQMLINLLTNAVKYTPDGGKIEVWAERIPGNKIKINIKDSGVGIEESDRHKVFAAFERIDNSYSMTQMGTGLGMPLTRKLAEVNGATIDFDSVAGEGTHFWLVFPAVQSDAAQLEDEEVEAAPPVEGKGSHILLVEKDEGERKMISRYLEHLGFKITGASSKREAIESLKTEDIELAVVGNNIADKPEDDIVGVIRDSARDSSMPLVLVSSRAFVFDIEDYLKQGVDRCLVKPIELRELAHTCRNLIDGTFVGEVVDREALNKTSEEKKKKVKKVNNLLSTKVYSGNLTDITH